MSQTEMGVNRLLSYPPLRKKKNNRLKVTNVNRKNSRTFPASLIKSARTLQQQQQQKNKTKQKTKNLIKEKAKEENKIFRAQ